MGLRRQSVRWFTLGKLECLDRPHRLAYVLGEIMELPGPESVEMLLNYYSSAFEPSAHSFAACLHWLRSYPRDRLVENHLKRHEFVANSLSSTIKK